MEAPLVGLDLCCLAAGAAHLGTAPVKRVVCMHQSSTCMPASALQVFGCASYMLFHGPLGPALSFLVRQGSRPAERVHWRGLTCCRLDGASSWQLLSGGHMQSASAGQNAQVALLMLRPCPPHRLQCGSSFGFVGGCVHRWRTDRAEALQVLLSCLGYSPAAYVL